MPHTFKSVTLAPPLWYDYSHFRGGASRVKCTTRSNHSLLPHSCCMMTVTSGAESNAQHVQISHSCSTHVVGFHVFRGGASSQMPHTFKSLTLASPLWYDDSHFRGGVKCPTRSNHSLLLHPCGRMTVTLGAESNAPHVQITLSCFTHVV